MSGGCSGSQQAMPAEKDPGVVNVFEEMLRIAATEGGMDASSAAEAVARLEKRELEERLTQQEEKIIELKKSHEHN